MAVLTSDVNLKKSTLLQANALNFELFENVDAFNRERFTKSSRSNEIMLAVNSATYRNIFQPRELHRLTFRNIPLTVQLLTEKTVTFQ